MKALRRFWCEMVGHRWVATFIRRCDERSGVRYRVHRCDRCEVEAETRWL